jgi:hypothetical protein
MQYRKNIVCVLYKIENKRQWRQIFYHTNH